MSSLAVQLVAYLASLVVSGSAFAGYLNVSTLTPGASGTFSGSIDGAAITGFVSANQNGFAIREVGSDYFQSTTSDSSSQYSSATIFAPPSPAADRLGYEISPNGSLTATFTINSSLALVNPVFHFANLDRMTVDFSATPGFSSAILLSGNGGSGDGLGLQGSVVVDLDPVTGIGISQASPPPISGARSAYGSVQLTGNFTVLNLILRNPNTIGDGGSFTLSASPVPEASVATTMVAGLLLVAGVSAVRRQRAHDTRGDA